MLRALNRSILQCSECPAVLKVLRGDVLLSGDMPLGLSSLWQRGCPRTPLQSAEMPMHHWAPMWE